MEALCGFGKYISKALLRFGFGRNKLRTAAWARCRVGRTVEVGRHASANDQAWSTDDLLIPPSPSYV